MKSASQLHGRLTTIIAFFLLILYKPANSQDSLRLKSLPFLGSLPYRNDFTDTNKPMAEIPNKKPGLIYLQQINFKPQTASINARYTTAANPMLLWKNDYPLTAEQMNKRIEDEQRENSVTNQVLKSVLSRKKNVAVKPVL